MTKFYIKPIDDEGYEVKCIEGLLEWCADTGEGSNEFTVLADGEEVKDLDFQIEEYIQQRDLEEAQRSPNFMV